MAPAIVVALPTVILDPLPSFPTVRPLTDEIVVFVRGQVIALVKLLEDGLNNSAPVLLIFKVVPLTPKLSANKFILPDVTLLEPFQPT